MYKRLVWDKNKFCMSGPDYTDKIDYVATHTGLPVSTLKEGLYNRKMPVWGKAINYLVENENKKWLSTNILERLVGAKIKYVAFDPVYNQLFIAATSDDGEYSIDCDGEYGLTVEFNNKRVYDSYDYS